MRWAAWAASPAQRQRRRRAVGVSRGRFGRRRHPGAHAAAGAETYEVEDLFRSIFSTRHSLVPKLRLGTHCHETLFRVGPPIGGAHRSREAEFPGGAVPKLWVPTM